MLENRGAKQGLGETKIHAIVAVGMGESGRSEQAQRGAETRKQRGFVEPLRVCGEPCA